MIQSSHDLMIPSLISSLSLLLPCCLLPLAALLPCCPVGSLGIPIFHHLIIRSAFLHVPYMHAGMPAYFIHQSVMLHDIFSHVGMYSRCVYRYPTYSVIYNYCIQHITSNTLTSVYMYIQEVLYDAHVCVDLALPDARTSPSYSKVIMYEYKGRHKSQRGIGIYGGHPSCSCPACHAAMDGQTHSE
jgi:hypothetical protein